MKTRYLVIILVALTCVFTYFTIRKMKVKAHRDYKVLIWDKYNICFLVAPNYKIKKTTNGFDYESPEIKKRDKVKKNIGSFSIHNRDFNPKMNRTHFGDFEGAYSKEVDLRVFEYKIAPNTILLDTFDFATKEFPNLLPVKVNCSKYLERFPVLDHL